MSSTPPAQLLDMTEDADVPPWPQPEPTPARLQDDGPIARRVILARRQLSAGLAPSQAEAVGTLAEHIDRLEAILRHTTDMITVLDRNGLVMFSNSAAGLITGHGEEVNNSNALDFIHPDDVQLASDVFDACCEVPGSSASAEIRIRHSDGSWHYVDAYAENCLEDPVAGVVVSMRDVCGRRDDRESLERANEAMSSFVAVASHDLRSPVAVIRGLAGVLAGDWDSLPNDERRDIADMVAKAADRMGRLVENLLIVSRLEAGAPAGRPETIALADAVAQAVRHMEDHTGVGVEVGEDLSVMADPDHLERILTNYLHNALHHGKPPITVRAGRAAGGAEMVEMVEIRVIDSGPGVPEEAVAHLFERFFRAEGTQARGTGLGLSIVRDLARAAGGEAWYEGGAAGGCFGVSLPGV
jgi:PAS domain S-box-containing protein